MSTRPPRRTAQISLQAQTVTFAGEDQPQTFALEPLSPNVQTYLALAGLKDLLLRAESPGLAWAELRDGVLKFRAPTPKPLSRIRQAIARAIAHAIAVAAAPKGKKAVIEAILTEKLPEAEARARALSGEEVKRLKNREDVQEQYRALFREPMEGDGEVSMLEAIGLLRPLHQDLDHPNEPAALSFDEACALQ